MPTFSRRLALAAALLAPAALLPARARAQTNPAVAVAVDVKAHRHPISPLIYGLCYPGTALTDLRCPIARLGGNNITRYNWQLNADNKGNDYFFESFADPNATPGERGDTFIAANRAAHAQSMLTIPLIDWVANVGANRAPLASFPRSLYPHQKDFDKYPPTGGNGIYQNDPNHADGTLITDNAPSLANVPNSLALQGAWVQHLKSTWGTAVAGGVRYYLMDNESGIWHGTHRDVHPQGASMDEMWAKFKTYGEMIKRNDPTAKIVGPEEWGWTGYLYSGRDAQWGPANGYNFAAAPDRSTHGGLDYIPWLLKQYAAYEKTTGKRLLDVLSVHFYPQGGEFDAKDPTTPALLAKRNRSTRALWDPAYKDETWINDYVKLAPRLKDWVAQYYPGTQIALTEYNWGAEGHMNGATAQADIWGILGREGVDIATRWTTPAPGSPAYQSLLMYRKYDGKKGSFGDTSVSAVAPNADVLSAFAAQNSATGALTIMIVSKAASGTTPVTVKVANFGAEAAAQVYQLAAIKPADQTAAAIRHLPEAAVANGTVSLTVPSPSVTLLILAPSPRNRQ